MMDARDQETVAGGRERLRVGATAVRLLFWDARATPALLEFREDTKVARMPSQILLAGVSVEDENELEELVLWPPGEEEAESNGESEEEDRPAPRL